jgi:hypothetical protein
LAHQKNRVQPHHGVIGVARQPEQVMVIEPELADNDEADKSAQKFGQEVDERVSEFADAGMILERRHFELEDQQRHHDGKYAVAEGLDASETQLTLSEPIEQVHAYLDAVLSAELSIGFMAARKVPRHGRRHTENRDECTNFVQERDAGQRNANGAIGNGSDQPHPNEREGAVDGSPGTVERAGNENKCGKDNEPDANKHEDVHVTSTPEDWL